MRISDWSSDVCSSDLGGDARGWRHRPSRPALYATAGPRSLHGSGDRAARQVIVTPRHLRQEEAMNTHVSPRRGDELLRADRAFRSGGGLAWLLARAPAGIFHRMLDRIDGGLALGTIAGQLRLEEHTSELPSIMSNSYAVVLL